MKILIFLKSVLVVAILLLIMIGSNGCTTFEIPAEICTYGQMTCDAGQYICENYEIPEPVCLYFNVACTNLNILCTSEYGSEQYKTALKNLNDANIALNKFVIEQNAAGSEK